MGIFKTDEHSELLAEERREKDEMRREKAFFDEQKKKDSLVQEKYEKQQENIEEKFSEEPKEISQEKEIERKHAFQQEIKKEVDVQENEKHQENMENEVENGMEALKRASPENYKRAMDIVEKEKQKELQSKEALFSENVKQNEKIDFFSQEKMENSLHNQEENEEDKVELKINQDNGIQEKVNIGAKLDAEIGKEEETINSQDFSLFSKEKQLQDSGREDEQVVEQAQIFQELKTGYDRDREIDKNRNDNKIKIERGIEEKTEPKNNDFQIGPSINGGIEKDNREEKKSTSVFENEKNLKNDEEVQSSFEVDGIVRPEDINYDKREGQNNETTADVIIKQDDKVVPNSAFGGIGLLGSTELLPEEDKKEEYINVGSSIGDAHAKGAFSTNKEGTNSSTQSIDSVNQEVSNQGIVESDMRKNVVHNQQVVKKSIEKNQSIDAGLVADNLKEVVTEMSKLEVVQQGMKVISYKVVFVALQTSVVVSALLAMIGVAILLVNQMFAFTINGGWRFLFYSVIIFALSVFIQSNLGSEE